MYHRWFPYKDDLDHDLGPLGMSAAAELGVFFFSLDFLPFFGLGCAFACGGAGAALGALGFGSGGG